MAKPAHSRLTWSGVFGSLTVPIERWSFGLTLSDNSESAAFDDAQMDGLADGLRTAYDVNLKALMPSDVILTECRYARVADTGYVEQRPDGTYRQGINAVPVPGTSTVTSLPLQTALCVSLDTQRPGASGKGRFFLPWPGGTAVAIQTTDKRINDVAANTIAGKARDFIVAINTISGGSAPVVVASSKGFVSTVTAVRVGRVPDTMRSRRGDMQEAYTRVLLNA